jgi:hypothetical protein
MILAIEAHLIIIEKQKTNQPKDEDGLFRIPEELK